MIKYNNDNSIIVGYIKELLNSFNLPKAKVFKEGKPIYPEILYLVDDTISQWSRVDNILKFKEICPYSFGDRILNLTDNYKITSPNYDVETHVYLGEYLRFLRDYNHLNLMSMYNCFTDEIVTNFELDTKGEAILVSSCKDNLLCGPNVIVGSQETHSYSINIKSDNRYKIYSIPVKFDQNYTIAIECDIPYDMWCGYYSNSLYNPSSEEDTLSFDTYRKIHGSKFNKPYIYRGLTEDINYFQGTCKFYPQMVHEKDLKLFIRLPYNVNSTITILEGEYLNNNNRLINSSNDYGKSTQAYTVLNFENKDADYSDIQLATQSQLLNINSGISYPFADRLIEYLCENVVSNTETISNNIKRIQQKFVERYKDSEEKTAEGKIIHSKIGTPHVEGVYGNWNSKNRALLYEIAKENNNAHILLNEKFDILGYLDKDIEKILGKDCLV